MQSPAHKITMAFFTALMLCAACGTGCSTFSVPAIDQSGERIFDPTAGRTRLVNPFAGTEAANGLLQPAWQSPPTPPPCPTPVAAVQPTLPVVTVPLQAAPLQPAAIAVAPAAARGGVFPGIDGNRGSLILNPLRMVAPINTEVVLMSGLCGEDGRYVTKQPIEWVLSQDSVGQFLAVGEDQGFCLASLRNRRFGKMSSSLAVSRSSTDGQLITRGTATPNDDIWVAAGQSWVSVSSSTEGTSHVTVVAPDAAVWDQRRQTATVHWIDAQWQPPRTAIAEAGQTQLLTTVVTRASNGSPQVGWIVRYEIIASDATAGFSPSGGSAVEVTTNATGSATAELVPRDARHGSTQVRVEIIRPGLKSGDLPRLTVGQEYTVVTWRASDLAVNVTGPQNAGIDSMATYNVTVSNPGDLPAHNVSLTGRPTRGLEFKGAEPAGTPFGDQYQWSLGDLAPHATRTIQVNCQVKARGRLQFCVDARSDEVASVQSCAETDVQIPSISLRLQGPDQVDVGQPAEFQVRVTNRGGQALTGVRIRDDFDAGLEHDGGQVSPIGIEVERIAPGETWERAIRFRVTQAGVLCHTVTVTADGGHQATARSCLTAEPVKAPPARPDIQVRVSGPAKVEVGEKANFRIQVTNSGDTELTTVHVLDVLSESFEAKQASQGHQWYQGGLLWTIPSLSAGQSETFDINCLGVKADPRATHRIAVSTDQKVSATDSLETEISAPPITPPSNGNGRDVDLPASGDLKLTVNSFDNPVEVGDDVRYLVQVTNDRDASDKIVEIVAIAAPGTRIKGISSTAVRRVPVDASQSNDQKWVIRFQELRANESVDLKVTVIADEPGMKEFSVQVQSIRTPEPIRETETTQVNPK